MGFIKNKLRLLFSLPKSVWVNFRCLPFEQAVKLPVIVDCGMQLDGNFKRGSIRISGPVSHGMILLGLDQGSFGMGLHTESLSVGKDAIIEFHGRCYIPRGCNIIVNEGAKVVFGSNCVFNSNVLINAGSEITFGDDFFCGWNVSILDGDGHAITDMTGNVLNDYKPISFGRHCWVASHASVLKGVHLADETIVPYGAVITKSNDVPYCIFGGSPNKVLKEQVKRS